MKLSSVHIREFKSIWDSNPFNVGKVTCLVGKNEAGKTALLQALFRLNPIEETKAKFSVTFDYPRAYVEDYRQDLGAKKRRPAIVIEATFSLEDEISDIEKEFGENVIPSKTVTVSRGYHEDESKASSGLDIDVDANEETAVAFLANRFKLGEDLTKRITQTCKTVSGLTKYLTAEATRHKDAISKAKVTANAIEDEAGKAAALVSAEDLGESSEAAGLRAYLETRKITHLSDHIWEEFLEDRFPVFLYFDEYYQMHGQDNIAALKKRLDEKNLESHDRPLLGLIDLARLDLDNLSAIQQTEELKGKLQSASNHLSKKILDYWSQNKHLWMTFDVRHGLPKDPPHMREGLNIWGEVEDRKHLVSTGLGTRSRGFVWFFSFLAWYSVEKKRDKPMVILLDEPGLSLHGKAQEDLLRYFEVEIASNPKHQLIYSTHSPFMVDPKHFERVLIVQDTGIDTDKTLKKEEDGTKVLSDVLEAGPDSLFPLQAALGYEIYQALFVGPNCLVVEGVSDLLFFQTISGALSAAGREALDPRWTVTPVGGSGRVPAFVSLIRSQKGLNVATLIDFQRSDKQVIENLYKHHLLEQSHVLTFAHFTSKGEADIEDMFDESFYLALVNAEYAKELGAQLTSNLGPSQHPRILVRIKEHLEANPLKGSAKFDHYRPARRLAENPAAFGPIPTATLDRFEAAFSAVNKLLPKT